MTVRTGAIGCCGTTAAALGVMPRSAEASGCPSAGSLAHSTWPARSLFTLAGLLPRPALWSCPLKPWAFLLSTLRRRLSSPSPHSAHPWTLLHSVGVETHRHSDCSEEGAQTHAGSSMGSAVSVHSRSSEGSHVCLFVV